MKNYAKSIEDTTILLVEDNAPLLRNAAFLLKVIGFEVLTAADGLAALHIMQQRTPDLVLCDIQMPRMTGYELLACARADDRWSETPFILMSDQYALDDLLYSLELGADDYLPKPFDAYDLLDAIKRVLPLLPGSALVEGMAERRAAS